MKWIIILPLLAVCLVGASPINVETKSQDAIIFDIPINTKIDSANLAMKRFLSEQL